MIQWWYNSGNKQPKQQKETKKLKKKKKIVIKDQDHHHPRNKTAIDGEIYCWINYPIIRWITQPVSQLDANHSVH